MSRSSLSVQQLVAPMTVAAVCRATDLSRRHVVESLVCERVSTRAAAVAGDRFLAVATEPPNADWNRFVYCLSTASAIRFLAADESTSIDVAVAADALGTAIDWRTIAFPRDESVKQLFDAADEQTPAKERTEKNNKIIKK